MKISMVVSQLGPQILDIVLPTLFPGDQEVAVASREHMKMELNEQLNKFVDGLQQVEVTTEHKAKAAWIAQHAVMMLMHHVDVSAPDEAVAMVGNVFRAALIEAKKS